MPEGRLGHRVRNRRQLWKGNLQHMGSVCLAHHRMVTIAHGSTTTWTKASASAHTGQQKEQFHPEQLSMPRVYRGAVTLSTLPVHGPAAEPSSMDRARPSLLSFLFPLPSPPQGSHGLPTPSCARDILRALALCARPGGIFAAKRSGWASQVDVACRGAIGPRLRGSYLGKRLVGGRTEHAHGPDVGSSRTKRRLFQGGVSARRV